MNRLEKLFRERKENILTVYFTAGFPKLNDTVLIASELEKAGVDMIEIGIPFSDPVADGPTIQASNKVALENGMTLKLLLEQVKEIRKEVSVPIILMGYLNPIIQFGFQNFCRNANANGVDGLILPDLPLDEFDQEYSVHIEKNNLSPIFLIAPTTSEVRIRKIDSRSNGFVYAVSSSSTTGARNNFTEDQIQYFKRLGSMQLKNPFLIGFGISSHQTFYEASKFSTGAIVGSAFIDVLGKSDDLKRDISVFVNRIRPTAYARQSEPRLS